MHEITGVDYFRLSRKIINLWRILEKVLGYECARQFPCLGTTRILDRMYSCIRSNPTKFSAGAPSPTKATSQVHEQMPGLDQI